MTSQETNDRLREVRDGLRETLNTVQDAMDRVGGPEAAAEQLRAAGEHYDVARGIVVAYLEQRGVDSIACEMWAAQILARLYRAGMRMGV